MLQFDAISWLAIRSALNNQRVLVTIMMMLQEAIVNADKILISENHPQSFDLSLLKLLIAWFTEKMVATPPVISEIFVAWNSS